MHLNYRKQAIFAAQTEVVRLRKYTDASTELSGNGLQRAVVVDVLADFHTYN